MSHSVSRRAAALAVLCAMSLMIVLDSTIVAVAVPDIQRDLGFSAAGVAWVVNAYLVAFAGLLLLAGRLGDLLGAWPAWPSSRSPACSAGSPAAPDCWWPVASCRAPAGRSPRPWSSA
jgi:MFS family permease